VFEELRIRKAITDLGFVPHAVDDSSADETPYPQRHAAAHGFGTKISNTVDSMNSVLLAHFVITTASVFQAYTRDEQPKR
jgi:hypothetical protein